MPELRTLDFDHLNKILETGTKQQLEEMCQQHNLIIRDGKIYAANSSELDYVIEYWDKIQLVRKISLNSLYGAILNPGCRFFDKRIGQSTTLTGRAIAQHMDAYVNECITGQYDHTGQAIIYGDTDSVAEESLIKVKTKNSVTQMSIKDLFNAGIEYWKDGDKEYSRHNDLQIAHYSLNQPNVEFSSYNYVYRHKVSKRRFRITTVSGKTVDVTEDHSIMILSNGKLVEKKPTDIIIGDQVITIL